MSHEMKQGKGFIIFLWKTGINNIIGEFYDCSELIFLSEEIIKKNLFNKIYHTSYFI